MSTDGRHATLEKLIDESELSRIIGRSVPSIRRDRLAGRGIPYVKLGHLVRYDVSDVRDYLDRCKKQTR
jgi:predicted DNA-binding transcriptional regulator AlpA